MGNFRSFKMGFSKYKKAFIEGKPRLFIVSNFLRAKEIRLSLKIYLKSKFDSSYKNFRNCSCKRVDTFWIRSNVEKADGMFFIAFL